ncbi:class A basic helix-loop-helix protein 9-like [Panicum hallii]|uniref:class A basic helix-loop-helix protein 9-like n=1 Tax=Panicum hallii TaxID=206008 RepID=UPI000DF4D7DF|nr:class A basic helix-loop-helix protein 9-like [Panicum hallii]
MPTAPSWLSAMPAAPTGPAPWLAWPAPRLTPPATTPTVPRLMLPYLARPMAPPAPTCITPAASTPTPPWMARPTASTDTSHAALLCRGSGGSGASTGGSVAGPPPSQPSPLPVATCA